MELATELLVKAVKYDNDNRKVEALSLYTEGINKLLDVAKSKQLLWVIIDYNIFLTPPVHAYFS